MIIVSIENPNFEALPGLAFGEFPIFPDRTSFQHNALNPSSSKKRSFSRTSFPLVPGYAMTGYCAQGQTFKRAILDLARPPGAAGGTDSDVYVLLSRLKTLDGLVLLRPFAKTVFDFQARADRASMITDLTELSIRTKTACDAGLRLLRKRRRNN